MGLKVPGTSQNYIQIEQECTTNNQYTHWDWDFLEDDWPDFSNTREAYPMSSKFKEELFNEFFRRQYWEQRGKYVIQVRAMH